MGAPPGQTMQRSSSLTMEDVRDLSSTLWTIRTNQETSRIYRTTHSILRFFLFFDICYLISGIALVTMALANQMEERNRMVVYGGLFCLCVGGVQLLGKPRTKNLAPGFPPSLAPLRPPRDRPPHHEHHPRPLVPPHPVAPRLPLLR